MQTAPRKLEAELVECFVADDGVVLEDGGEVARLVQTGARAGVLAEDLILCRGLDPCHKRWRYAHAQKGIIAVVPALVQPRRPQARFFSNREVPTQGSQRHK